MEVSEYKVILRTSRKVVRNASITNHQPSSYVVILIDDIDYLKFSYARSDEGFELICILNTISSMTKKPVNVSLSVLETE